VSTYNVARFEDSKYHTKKYFYFGTPFANAKSMPFVACHFGRNRGFSAILAVDLPT